jgi:hypothetical protein
MSCELSVKINESNRNRETADAVITPEKICQSSLYLRERMGESD